MGDNLRYTITIFLGLGVILLIGYNLVDIKLVLTQDQYNIEEPIHKSKYTTTMVYNKTGELNYKLVADYVVNFTKQQTIWFTQPVATLFDNNKVPTWIIKADKAKLISDRMLYLYGNVQMDSLSDDM